MGKILKIQDDGIIVQLENNGKIYKLKRNQFSFEPTEGDLIVLSKKNNQLYITKKNLGLDLDLDLDFSSSNDLSNDLGLQNTQNKQDKQDNSNYSNSQNKSYEESSGTNKVIYILLALFLGTAGAHRFYARKSDAPVYLAISVVYWISAALTVFIPSFSLVYFIFILMISGLGIKVLIDIIVAITRSADSSGNISI